MNFAPLSRIRVIALSLLLTWLAPRPGRAENSLSFKHEDYHETGGRIVVRTQGAFVEQDFGPATHLQVEGVLDAIAGATPNGQPAANGSDQVPLARITEQRKAWSAALGRQFAPGKLTLGVANSRERDYVSTGWSANAQGDFNQKNTTLLFGVAGTDDKIKVFYQAARARKRTNDIIAGVTQLVDRNTSLTLNLTWGRQSGYLSDPYKLVQKDTEIVTGVFLPLTFPENRPDERDKWIALANLNRALPELRATLDLAYRLYHDTFGTTAHTLDLSWFQRFGQRVIVRPSLRLYRQNAAEFYRYRLDGTAIAPAQGAPRPQGPFYSSDYRLSEMQTVTGGIKVVWRITDALQLDARYDRYEMRGSDGVTPQSAYPSANIWAVGAKFSW